MAEKSCPKPRQRAGRKQGAADEECRENARLICPTWLPRLAREPAVHCGQRSMGVCVSQIPSPFHPSFSGARLSVVPHGQEHKKPWMRAQDVCAAATAAATERMECPIDFVLRIGSDYIDKIQCRQNPLLLPLIGIQMAQDCCFRRALTPRWEEPACLGTGGRVVGPIPPRRRRRTRDE